MTTRTKVKPIEAADGDHERYARELRDRLPGHSNLGVAEVGGEWWLVREGPDE